MGDLEAQSTKAQMAQPWSYQLFAVLMLLVLTMCATLTVFVAIKSSQNEQMISDLQNFYMDNFDEEDKEVVLTKHTIRNARSAVNGFVEVCNSTFYPSLNVTPSAHLVGSTELDPHENDNSGSGNYIRCGWSCQDHGHVHGGMKVEDGKIIVPVEGIYMVYSQVKIHYDGKGHENIHYGHYTIRANSEKSPLNILQSVNTASSRNTYSAHHQSGLFYIQQGGTIYVSLSFSDKVKLSLAKNIRYDPESTYFGAYYVSGCNKDGCPELNNYYV